MASRVDICWRVNSAPGVYVCMCRGDPERREEGGGEGWREKKEVKREEGWGRGGAETSRTGKITHFDGIKMSVFPSPYLHGDSAPLESERETKREREREITDFCLSFRSARRLDGTRVCSRLNRSKRLPDIEEFAFWTWSKV